MAQWQVGLITQQFIDPLLSFHRATLANEGVVACLGNNPALLEDLASEGDARLEPFRVIFDLGQPELPFLSLLIFLHTQSPALVLLY